MTSDIDPFIADMLLKAGRQRPARIIWTASRIAQRIDRGEDFVRKVLAKMPGSPVKKIGGRLCVDETELFAFLRNPEDTR